MVQSLVVVVANNYILYTVIERRDRYVVQLDEELWGVGCGCGVGYMIDAFFLFLLHLFGVSISTAS